MKLEHQADRSGKLLSFLRRELRLSSTLVNRLKVQNAMFVNGVHVYTNHMVIPGDIVSVIIEEPTPEYPAEPYPLSILYEDEAVIAIDKPAGIMMHPSRSRNTGTLANYLTYYYQQTGQKCAVHPVSRLDRDTFGVVLLAKNAHTHARLCDAHLNGQIQKTYHAAIWGHLPKDSGIIDLPIARVSPTSLFRCVREDGQRAITEFRVLEQTTRCSLVELHPKTGRTHQLRVHLSHLGCPMLGDPQYGTEESQNYSLPHGFQWQQLCAASLEFPHPLTDERIFLQSRQIIRLPQD